MSAKIAKYPLGGGTKWEPLDSWPTIWYFVENTDGWVPPPEILIPDSASLKRPAFATTILDFPYVLDLGLSEGLLCRPVLDAACDWPGQTVWSSQWSRAVAPSGGLECEQKGPRCASRQTFTSSGPGADQQKFQSTQRSSSTCRLPVSLSHWKSLQLHVLFTAGWILCRHPSQFWCSKWMSLGWDLDPTLLRVNLPPSPPTDPT